MCDAVYSRINVRLGFLLQAYDNALTNQDPILSYCLPTYLRMLYVRRIASVYVGKQPYQFIVTPPDLHRFAFPPLPKHLSTYIHTYIPTPVVSRFRKYVNQGNRQRKRKGLIR